MRHFNVLYLTQSRTLEVFHALSRILAGNSSEQSSGYYVADQVHYNEFVRRHAGFPQAGSHIVKEWDILQRSVQEKADTGQLRNMEKRLGDPYLWNAVVADRRLYLGPRAMLEQDYRQRFDHERLLAILQVGIRELESLFDRVQPDIVVGFICVTLGDYLGYLIARARGIPFLNLRPTRIANYFIAGESIYEPPQRFTRTFEKLREDGIDSAAVGEVDRYLEKVRRTHAMYEGVIPATASLPDQSHRTIRKRIAGVFKTTARLALTDIRRALGEYRHEGHYHPGLYWLWFEKIKKPWRQHRMRRLCLKSGTTLRHLAGIDYAFFPLHKEPEVSLLVYARPYVNQIEVVRNIARSLPVGMKLVVKEHPAATGYRPATYYKKLLQIPNVLLVPASVPSRDVLQHARIVAVIAGSIALEAAIMQKPVVTLGQVPFNVLPPSMVRHAGNLDELAETIRDLLENHTHNEAALRAYVAAVHQEGIPVNFYSQLLKRKGVYQLAEDETDHTRSSQIMQLAEYVRQHLPHDQRNATTPGTNN